MSWTENGCSYEVVDRYEESRVKNFQVMLDEFSTTPLP